MDNIKIPLRYNKSNGQIQAFLRKKDLSNELFRDIKQNKKKNLFVEIKGLI